MPIPKLSGQISSSNYLSFDGANENITLIAMGAALNKRASITLGVGNDCTTDNGIKKNKPAIELKAKYNIGQHLNTQFRFREIGGVEQYRLTFGGSYKIDKNQSVYLTAHATAKNSEKWKCNTGGWIGYTYKFNNGISVSAEFQQNIPLNNTGQSAAKTLAAFDDSNKMVNVIASVPLSF